MTLAAEGIVLRRAGRAVLDGVSLRAGPGSFVAVVGANGAGKSSLLGVLAGLVRPEAGTVCWQDQSLAALPGRTLARLRGWLPQAPRCDWPISVAQLVELGLMPQAGLLGRPGPGSAGAVRAAMAECDVEGLAGRSADALSGGELARVMLARALVGRPALLVVDEPVAGLDPGHALDALALLRRQADAGRVVVAALHEVALAARFATRMVALRGGRVVADGAPAEVLTAALLHTVFGVRAHVTQGLGGALVEFLH